MKLLPSLFFKSNIIVLLTGYKKLKIKCLFIPTFPERYAKRKRFDCRNLNPAVNSLDALQNQPELVSRKNCNPKSGIVQNSIFTVKNKIKSMDLSFVSPVPNKFTHTRHPYVQPD